MHESKHSYALSNQLILANRVIDELVKENFELKLQIQELLKSKNEKL